VITGPVTTQVTDGRQRGTGGVVRRLPMHLHPHTATLDSSPGAAAKGRAGSAWA